MTDERQKKTTDQYRANWGNIFKKDLGKMTKKLTVLVPAIKTEDGTIIKAPSKDWSHADIKKSAHVTGEHGFVLSDGSYADRRKAAKVAEKAGEVTKKEAGNKLHSHELRKGK